MFGKKAAAIGPRTVFNAEALVRALPGRIPLPEFAPEPDGSVSLDWIQSRSRMFSLSVGIGTRLAYVWLDGADKGHVVARFDGLNVPPRVLEGIHTIMNHGRTLKGAAVFKAKVVRSIGLDVIAKEPPPAHANVEG